jgi:hypothetical protein
VKPIRLVAKDPAIDITIPMGDGAPVPGGFGGWTTVDLQDAVQGTDWEGQEPLTEDVVLLLDGLDGNDPVDRQWQTVKRLGRPGGDRERPPVFRVYGPLDAPEGKAWVLPAQGIAINEEETIKRDRDGAYLRIEFTLHLLEYNPPEVIADRKRRRGVAKKPSDNLVVGGTHTVSGDGPRTLWEIAFLLYDDYNRWVEIGNKNGIRSPFLRLPPGKRLKL